jgi:hypothetical protein
MRKVGDQRYLVQEWKNGSYCDLAKQPRTVEVQVQFIFLGKHLGVVTYCCLCIVPL